MCYYNSTRIKLDFHEWGFENANVCWVLLKWKWKHCNSTSNGRPAGERYNYKLYRSSKEHDCNSTCLHHKEFACCMNDVVYYYTCKQLLRYHKGALYKRATFFCNGVILVAHMQEMAESICKKGICTTYNGLVHDESIFFEREFFLLSQFAHSDPEATLQHSFNQFLFCVLTWWLFSLAVSLVDSIKCKKRLAPPWGAFFRTWPFILSTLPHGNRNGGQTTN